MNFQIYTEGRTTGFLGPRVFYSFFKIRKIIFVINKQNKYNEKQVYIISGVARFIGSIRAICG